MMASRIGFPGTITPGETVGSADNNHLPGGCIGYAAITASVNGIGTTPVDIVSVTVTLNDSRMVKITAKWVSLLQTASSPVAFMSLLNGSTVVDEQNCPVYGVGFQAGDSIVALDIAPASGATTYKLQAATNVGTMSLGAGAAGQRCFIMVEDVGPTF